MKPLTERQAHTERGVSLGCSRKHIYECAAMFESNLDKTDQLNCKPTDCPLVRPSSESGFKAESYSPASPSHVVEADRGDEWVKKVQM